MTRSFSTGPKLYLTRRALRDIADIEHYSIERFGKRIVQQYLHKLQSALRRISANTELLHHEPDFHQTLQFYRVEEHLLVCETGLADCIIVLAVIHSSMDIPSRLAELEPRFALEVASLLRELRKSQSS